MSDRYLTDDQWARIAPLLPGKDGDPGCTGRDNRLFLEAVLWTARTGAPWRDLPQEFGKWYTTYTRFRRWSVKGVWPRVFAALHESGDCDYSFENGEVFWRALRGMVAERGDAENKAAA